MSKLIAIDGVDSSGKGLQTKMLFEALKEKNDNVVKISFPDYESESSALVRMYLSGEFGKEINSVNGYAASLFFAVDRYASFKKNWKANYEKGDIIICDRYVSSNAIHQSVKIEENKRDEFLSWIDDVEYEKLGLPRPDMIFFLDMPVDMALKLMDKRYNGDVSKKDIHEADEGYLSMCHQAAEYACDKFGWQRIDCVVDGVLRTPEDIHNEIMEKVNSIL